ARAFVEANAAVFGLTPSLASLETAAVRQSPAGHHVRFAQQYEGLPVFNGGLEVSLDHDNRVVLVQDDCAPVEGFSTSPRLTAAAAARVAERHFAKTYRFRKNTRDAFLSKPAGVVRLLEEPEPSLGVYPTAKGPRLAYRLTLVVDDPPAAQDYLIDARNGKVLRHQSLEQTAFAPSPQEAFGRAEAVAAGSGDVFDPNPVNTLNDGTLEDNADADYPALAGAYLDRPLPEITRFLGIYFLVGPYARVTDIIEAPRNYIFLLGYMPSSSPDFDFRRNDMRFEHVVCYHHIDANQRYIQSLGFTDVNNRSMMIDPHGLRGADNAHYLGFPIGAGYIALGDGGVDDGEDADVIIHEYGHAIQDNQSTGKYLSLTIETGAQGEGFADYWAASSTHATSLANGFDPACVGEWDSTSYRNENPPCLRRVDGTKHYPEDLEGQVHADGEIWSSALWDLFNTLGKGTADTLVLQSHFLVPFNPDFSEGAAAILDADALLFSGANAGAICQAFTDRGIAVTGC
ncbi:MAG: M36 family metallopeptidase, partial [Deltaproteobacteria bacterium]|nr:M36 family metallopeptidase [Deltaproteobacteria bacterium]